MESAQQKEVFMLLSQELSFTLSHSSLIHKQPLASGGGGVDREEKSPFAFAKRYCVTVRLLFVQCFALVSNLGYSDLMS